MSDTITHVAGLLIVFNGRGIQRCAVCGHKLIDNKNCESPQTSGSIQDEKGPLQWQEGALVQVEAGNPSRHLLVGHFLDTERPLPEDACVHEE